MIAGLINCQRKDLHKEFPCTKIRERITSGDKTMVTKNYNPSIVEEVFGAFAIAGTIITSPVTRSWYGKWGADDHEVGKELPGDEIVPDPNLTSTRAITIQAPKSEVWPWLLQMGQGRGGLYSYERLENLVGCEMHNADRILPEYQHLVVGDKVRLVPEERNLYFDVVAIENERAIILSGDDPPTTWAFILESGDHKSTRLIVRWRQAYEPTLGNQIMWRLVTDPITFVMERKLLQGIKIRTEAHASGQGRS
jgi:hypothetical protein